jgi:hypothetical protein
MKEQKQTGPTLDALRKIEKNTARIAASLEVLAKNSDRTTGTLAKEYGGGSFVRTLTISD